MALLLWVLVTCFYMFFGILYLKVSTFDPLGAMALPGISNNLIFTFLVGLVITSISYKICSRKNIKSFKILEKDSFLIFSSLCFCIMSLGCFFIGVQYYGGYFSFLHTPYVAIFSGNAENGIKDVLISSSGLMAIFSILCSFHIVKKYTTSRFLIILSLIVLFSIFIQGRRETLLLLLMTFASYKFLNDRFSIKTIIKAIIIIIALFSLAGLGLYLRASTDTSGGSFTSAIINAILFETHFTIANLANEIATHDYNNFPYGGIGFLLYPILFIIPSFVFSLFGYDKSQVFSFNEPKIYEDKGGSFIFTEAYHSLGITGVIVHAVLLGALISYFYAQAKKSSNILYHFPIVSLILVSSRKDIIYGIKYISLEFILLFAFYILYIILPKRKHRK